MDMHVDPQYKTDDGSALRIWKDAAQNNFLSEKEGRAIFDEVTFVEVISPGSGNSTPVFEVMRVLAPEANHPTPKYGPKYPEYKKFLLDFESSENLDTSLAGTPLGQWAEMTRTMVAAMKAQKIYTVDALAQLPDSKLYVVGPDGRSWRDKAIAHIENAKNTGYATHLAAELTRQKADNEDLQEQVKVLAAQVAKLEAKPPSTAPQVQIEETARVVQTPAIPPPMDHNTLASPAPII